MIPFCILTALATSFEAQYISDASGHPHIVVREHGKKHIVKLDDMQSFGKGLGVKGDYYGIKYHGYTFQHKDDQIINVKTGLGIDIKPVSVLPHYDGSHIFRFQNAGCAIVNDSMLWIYTMSDIDNMGEPFAFVDAFLVTENKGTPVLTKSISIPGLEGGLYSPKVSKVGHDIYFGATWGRIAVLSVETWKAKALGIEDMALSDDGKLFWLDQDILKLWNPKLNLWKVIRRTEAKHLQFARKVGSDYLLQFKDTMAYAYSSKSCPIADESFKETFFDPKVGIGFAWRTDKETFQMTGVFYRISDLKEVVKITGHQ